MIIRQLQGDVLKVAPQVAEAAVLWLRCGFNCRSMIWNFGLRNMDLTPLSPSAYHPEPWRSHRDSIWRLNDPVGHLRYVYVFSNPSDSMGCCSESQVRDAVTRCMEQLNRLQIRRLAMIHIPIKASHGRPDRESNLAGAKAMIEALKAWDQQHQGEIEEVVLVDLGGDFKSVL